MQDMNYGLAFMKNGRMRVEFFFQFSRFKKEPGQKTINKPEFNNFVSKTPNSQNEVKINCLEITFSAKYRLPNAYNEDCATNKLLFNTKTKKILRSKFNKNNIGSKLNKRRLSSFK